MSDYRRHIGRDVLVQLDDDEAIIGTLTRATATVIELSGAAFVSGETSGDPMDGAVVVERLRVKFVQVPA